MGPRFIIRSHLQDRHPCPTVGFEPGTQGSSNLCARAAGRDYYYDYQIQCVCNYSAEFAVTFILPHIWHIQNVIIADTRSMKFFVRIDIHHVNNVFVVLLFS
jgi:hypothetical protein